MNASGLFYPTIPITVRRVTGEHLADGTADVRAGVGPMGFTTRYLTAFGPLDGTVMAELLADEACELELSTGHRLAGHFYPSADASAERAVLVFIPTGTEEPSSRMSQ